MIPSHFFTLVIFLFIVHLNLITMPEKRNFSSYSITFDQHPPLMGASNKKLRRLPHVFSKVLELPFHSNIDVSVNEQRDCFIFSVEATNDELVDHGTVKAHVIEVHPGIKKVVIRRKNDLARPIVDELELDLWRFRLPSAAVPELATAVYANGELVVKVPKNYDKSSSGCGECKEGFKGNMGNFVLVQ